MIILFIFEQKTFHSLKTLKFTINF